jgi:uncharacterized integral membrane protein
MPDSPAPRSSANTTRLVVLGIAVILLVWFALANSARVEVDFIIFDRDARLIYVIIVSAVLGAIIGALIRRSRRDG